MLLKHWIASLTERVFARRPARRRNNPHARAIPQCVDKLEQRALLSAVGGAQIVELPSFQVDASSYSESHILVRFKEGAQLPAEVEGGELMRGTNIHNVRVGQGATVARAVEAFQRRPDVLYAQPDYTLHALGHMVPNDELYNNGGLWGLHNTGQSSGTADADIDAPEAWHVTTGSRSIVVGVIDTGVDHGHPDLKTNVWVNPGETAGDGVDNDGNGYVDDIHGYDFVNNDGDPMDDNGHGSHVSGTIGASANNGGSTGTDVVGVAWDVSIMGLKFLSSSGSGSSSNAIRALDYVKTMRELYNSSNGAKGANVLLTNNSWGGGGYDQALKDAIDANGAAGILFVAAAGNGDFLGRGQDNDANPSYPASYDSANIIAVAASDRNDQYASFSNYGATTVDLAAPGVEIWSTIPFNKDTSDGSKDGYARYNGTSMAAPHVSGAVALVWSANPGLTLHEVKDIVLGTVDPISGRDTVTDGRLNAAGAVDRAAALADAKPSVTVTSPSDGASVEGTITVTANATDDNGVTQVEFFIDTTSIGVDANGADGWSVAWDTTTYADASYTVTARATDTAGQTGGHSISAVVDNVDSPPSVTIASPGDGTAVRGNVTVTAEAADDHQVAQVEFFVDTISIGVDTDGSNGWSVIWDTSAQGDGTHALTAKATDVPKATGSEAKTAEQSVTLTVDNSAPTVQVTQPTAGAEVSGTVTVVADASDVTSGVSSVEFFDGSTTIGVDRDGSDGWSASWDTTTAAAGSHTITAVATDAAGNQTTSSGVTVQVVQAGDANEMYVAATSWSERHYGRWQDLSVAVDLNRDSNKSGTADDGDERVAGATVYLDLEYDGDGDGFDDGRWTASGTTDSGGRVVFQLKKAGEGVYRATVTNVAYAGYFWDGSLDQDNPSTYDTATDSELASGMVAALGSGELSVLPAGRDADFTLADSARAGAQPDGLFLLLSIDREETGVSVPHGTSTESSAAADRPAATPLPAVSQRAAPDLTLDALHTAFADSLIADALLSLSVR